MAHLETLNFEYDFEKALIRLGKDPLVFVDHEKQLIKVPIRNEKIITVQSIGTKENPQFHFIGDVSEKDIETIRKIFHFNKSLQPIYDHFKNTNLAPLFEQFKATPIVRDFSLYDTLMRSIIHQQLNMSFAQTLTKRFVEAYGSKIDDVYIFPTPERVAEVSVEELREMQFSQRKAEYTIGVSQAIVNGQINLVEMEKMSDEEIFNQLIKLRGVGPWTVECFLLFGLGRPNLFPIADIGLQNALKKLWNLEKKPTADEMKLHFADWEPYMSYASLYLWHSIE